MAFDTSIRIEIPSQRNFVSVSAGCGGGFAGEPVVVAPALLYYTLESFLMQYLILRLTNFLFSGRMVR